MNNINLKRFQADVSVDKNMITVLFCFVPISDSCPCLLQVRGPSSWFWIWSDRSTATEQPASQYIFFLTETGCRKCFLFVLCPFRQTAPSIRRAILKTNSWTWLLLLTLRLTVSYEIKRQCGNSRGQIIKEKIMLPNVAEIKLYKFLLETFIVLWLTVKIKCCRHKYINRWWVWRQGQNRD